jgi:uncharacterized protein with PIN domain
MTNGEQGSEAQGRNRPRNFRRRPRRISPPKDPAVVGFLCDVMLGKLARELRLLGMDVEYERNLAGMAAYRVARQRGRILLSRANRLRELEGVIFITSTAAAEQVAQVKAALEAGLKPPVPVDVPREQPASGQPAPEAESAAEQEAVPETEAPVVPIPSMVLQTGLVSVIPGAEPAETEPQAEPGPETGPELAPEPEQKAEPRPEPRPEPKRHEPRRHEPRPQQQQPKPRREEQPRETPELGRCLDCNVPLEPLARESARPLVPFFIYQIHHEFRRCPKCRNVFWPGSHVADMEKRARPAPQPRHQGPRRRRPDSRRHGPSQ